MAKTTCHVEIINRSIAIELWEVDGHRERRIAKTTVDPGKARELADRLVRSAEMIENARARIDVPQPW